MPDTFLLLAISIEFVATDSTCTGRRPRKLLTKDPTLPDALVQALL